MIWREWTKEERRGPHGIIQTQTANLERQQVILMCAYPLMVCLERYNVASQVVLAHVAVVSHGMLELFKRVFVLLAASALIGDVEWRWHNAAGAALATIGTVLYFRTMSEHPASHRKGGGTSATASASGIQSKKHSPRDGATGGGGGSSASGLRLHVAYILMTLVLVVSPVEFLGDGFSFARGGATPTSVIGNGAARRTPGDGNVLSYAPLEMFGMDVDPPQASAYLPSSDAAGMPTPVLVGGILGLKDMLPFHRNLPRAPVSGGACGGGGSVGRETLGRADGGGPEADGSRRRIAQDGASSASSSSPRGLAGVYTGWLDKQNMGDDIVADIFLDVLAAAVIRATDGRTCVTLERLSPGLAAAGLPGGCTLKNSAGCDFGVLGGGSLGEGGHLKGRTIQGWRSFKELISPKDNFMFQIWTCDWFSSMLELPAWGTNPASPRFCPNPPYIYGLSLRSLH